MERWLRTHQYTGQQGGEFELKQFSYNVDGARETVTDGVLVLTVSSARGVDGYRELFLDPVAVL